MRKFNGGKGGVDLREVAAVARSEFRANGYLNHRLVYDTLFRRFGAKVFEKAGFVKMTAAVLEEAFCPPELLRVILSRWFEDPALLRAGYRDLVDNDEV